MTRPLTRQAIWRQRFPERYRAHLALESAKRRGLLAPQPCAHCGNEGAEAHHVDYDRPLEVVWLCRRCHCRLHAKERRA